jgi:hypothetical protein
LDLLGWSNGLSEFSDLTFGDETGPPAPAVAPEIPLGVGVSFEADSLAGFGVFAVEVHDGAPFHEMAALEAFGPVWDEQTPCGWMDHRFLAVR